MSHKKPFYGVSNHDCNNHKLFDFVEVNQKTDKTILEFRKRIEDGKEECFIGVSVNIHSDGNLDTLSLMHVQHIWDFNEHAQASAAEPKIYFL